jgi:hypothetical protein
MSSQRPADVDSDVDAAVSPPALVTAWITTPHGQRWLNKMSTSVTTRGSTSASEDEKDAIPEVITYGDLHFDEESAAINLQPKTFAECTQVPLKRATLNTDGRGCVARSPDKGTTKRLRNTHQMSF